MQNAFDDYQIKEFKNKKDIILQNTRKNLLFKIQQHYVDKKRISSQKQNILEIKDKKISNENRIKTLKKYTDSLQQKIQNHKYKSQILRQQSDKLRKQINNVRANIKEKSQYLQYIKLKQPIKKTDNQINILENIRAEGNYQKQIQKFERQCQIQLEEWLKEEAQIVQYNKQIRKVQSEKLLSSNLKEKLVKKEVILIPALNNGLKFKNTQKLTKLQIEINGLNMKELQKGRKIAKKYLELYKLLNPIKISNYQDIHLLTLFENHLKKMVNAKYKRQKSSEVKYIKPKYFAY